MQKIRFFNHFHNGDCFIGKGWVNLIMQSFTLKKFQFEYYHNRTLDIIKDLNIPMYSVNELDINHRYLERIFVIDDIIYINTWCGCFQGDLFPYGSHSNFRIQYEMYLYYIKKLNEILNISLIPWPDVYCIIPYINYMHFDTSKIQNFINNEAKEYESIFLFCNGEVQSGQSSAGNFGPTIDALSDEYKNILFVCTEKLSLRKKNIYYIDEISPRNPGESNLNQIAYLAKYNKCKLIIGKNSGPSTFCMNVGILADKNKTLITFANKLEDCLDDGLDLPINSLFSPITNDTLITDIIRTQYEEHIHRNISNSL